MVSDSYFRRRRLGCGCGEGDGQGDGEMVGKGGVALGLGHTLSLLSSGTNSLILSKRYCCRSRGSPGGTIWSGNVSGHSPVQTSHHTPGQILHDKPIKLCNSQQVSAVNRSVLQFNTHLFLFWPLQLSACRYRFASPRPCVSR